MSRVFSFWIVIFIILASGITAAVCGRIFYRQEEAKYAELVRELTRESDISGERAAPALREEPEPVSEEAVGLETPGADREGEVKTDKGAAETGEEAAETVGTDEEPSEEEETKIYEEEPGAVGMSEDTAGE